MKLLKTKIKATFIVKWLILYIVASILFVACKADLSKVKQPENIDALPQLSVTNFSPEYKTNNRLQVQAFAPLMNKYTFQNYTDFPKGVTIKFFDEDFNVSTSLTCKYAINYEQQQLWKFSDSVVVVNENGGILKTQELYFNQKNNKIYSVKYVEIIDMTGSIMRGKAGFESNYNFTEYEFKNVDGSFIMTDDIADSTFVN